MLVYLLLLACSFSLSYIGVYYRRESDKFWTFPIILLFFIIVIVVGLRDGVGADFEGYREVFNDIRFEGAWRFEIGFRYMMQKFSDWGFEAWSIFLFSAVITWFFIFLSFQRFPWIMPWAFFFIITGGWFFSSLNGIRQIIAVSIFVYAFNYILSKEFLKFFILIIFASLFHKSVLLTVPLYFFIDKISFKAPVWLYIYILSFPLAHFADVSPIIERAFDSVNGIFSISILETDHEYSTDTLTTTYGDVYNSGLGLFFTYTFTGLLIFAGQKFVRGNNKYIAYFNMFYIWALVFMFTWHMSIFNRVLMYFIVFGIYIFGFVSFEYIRDAKWKYLIHLLLIMQLLYCLHNIYDSTYNFIPINFF